MSYQVLARKWRPKSFEELVGQKQTARALINALESQRLHHAYLFTGTRGVGKTTIARILSKSLNCETGITSKPCGECSSCTEIDQGNFVDLMEIDAASKTKVEDTRELLDNVQYRPTRGRYKVYLIDEVHMLSGHSFNALLKTLEEPPPHVIFLLATTDPQKLPVTVLSRCLQFHLKRMDEDQIVDHLSMILTAEKIDFEADALAPIAKGADGSMRDGLSLLDQAIAFTGDNIQLAQVLEMLGSIDQSYCFQLLDAICANDASTLMVIIQEMSQYSPDYFEVMSDWLSLLHTIAVAQATSNSDQDQINELADKISAADLQLFYQLSLQAKKDMAFAPHPRQGFEMALLRVIAFRPAKTPSENLSNNQVTAQKKKSVETNLALSTQSEIQNQTDDITKKNSRKDSITDKCSATQTVATETDVKGERTPSNTPVSTEIETEKTDAIKGVLASQKSIKQQAVGSQSSGKNTGGVEPGGLEPDGLKPSPLEAIKLEQICEQNWHLSLGQMTVDGNSLQLLLNSVGCYQGGQLLITHLKSAEHFLTDNLRQAIVKSLSAHFERDQLKVTFVSAKSLARTPKDRQTESYRLALQQGRKRLIEDPCVTALLDGLGAKVDSQSLVFDDKESIIALV